jgi:hypothetical protein
MKIYDLVKKTLIEKPDTRNSDKVLFWEIIRELGLLKFINFPSEAAVMTYSNFLKAPSTETIRRCRQKIQETHLELRASKKVQLERKIIENSKGTYIFREGFNF